jgi:ribonuclease Y
MPSSEIIGAALAALIVGVVLGYVARRFVAASAVRHAEHYAERIVAEARAKQKEIVLEGKDDALQAQRAAEEEARAKRADLQRQERLLLDRSESLDRKVETLERREAAFDERVREVEEQKARLAELQQQQIGELERASGLTAGEARQSLIRMIVDEAQAEAQQHVREIERHATEEGDERARRILTTVMQRIAADHTSEATVTVVALPSEEMKGRIIGREGRNIRALEQATGVDLIIDDTPEAVVLSGFDPVRREVARMALTKLIGDGRIHPGRI